MPKNKQQKTVVITGGHAATTALALIQSLRNSEVETQYNFHWIGSKTSLQGTKIRGIEHKLFPDFGVEMHTIITGKLQRRFSLATILEPLKIPFGFLQSLMLLLKIKPDVVVSFGGYAAFPIVVVAHLLRIPSVLHEQTTAAGLANRLSSLFVSKIALAREESLSFFPKHKTHITGNPVRSEILNIPPKLKLHSPPILLITGGSRGSQRINEALEGALRDLLEHYQLVHLTGHLDFKHFRKLKAALPQTLKKKYEIHSVVDTGKMEQLYSQCDIVIARAGANTVSEIMAIKIPSILIPIPWVQYNEQHRNAHIAQDSGIATIIHQSSLSPETLVSAVREVTKNWQRMIKEASTGKTAIDRDASKNLASLIQQYL